jgi:hypothetical protein
VDAKTIQVVEGTSIQINDQNGNLRDFKLEKLFTIDEDNLSAEMAHQASLYGYFATIAVKAEHQAAMLDMATEQMYAETDVDIREKAAKDGVKITEAGIKAQILLDAEYVALAESALGSKYDFKLLKAIAGALEQRANMLISLGAYKRHELDQTAMNTRQSAYDKTIEAAKEVVKAKRAK